MEIKESEALLRRTVEAAGGRLVAKLRGGAGRGDASEAPPYVVCLARSGAECAKLAAETEARAGDERVRVLQLAWLLDTVSLHEVQPQEGYYAAAAE